MNQNLMCCFVTGTEGQTAASSWQRVLVWLMRVSLTPWSAFQWTARTIALHGLQLDHCHRPIRILPSNNEESYLQHHSRLTSSDSIIGSPSVSGINSSATPHTTDRTPINVYGMNRGLLPYVLLEPRSSISGATIQPTLQSIQCLANTRGLKVLRCSTVPYRYVESDVN